MGICIKCGNECKDNHKYCIECYKKAQNYCILCSNPLFENDNFIDYKENELICEKCFEIIYKKINKYIPTHKATDGHWVRSRGEMIVDNYFFTNNISHIYEKKVFNKNNPEENCTCDFYIPKYNAYIEIWGYEDDPKYEEQKIFKEKIYQSNNIKIINIYPKNIDSGIDDFLTKELLKYEKELD